MNTTLRAALLATATSVGATGAAQSATLTELFSSFYVLGDSLSDDGNLPGLAWALTTGGAPYAGDVFSGGTITNGDVWNEGVRDAFLDAGRDAQNFARGGAEVLEDSFGGISPGLESQVTELLAADDARGDRPLVAIWAGANDLFEAVGLGTGLEVADAAANKIKTEIERLFDEGYSDFVVFNLPDLALTPRFNLFSSDEEAAAASLATQKFNMTLAGNLSMAETDALNIIDFDVAARFSDVLFSAADLGISDVIFPCVFPEGVGAIFGQDDRCSDTTGGLADARFFIDSVHPNRLVHAEIGRQFEDRVLTDGIAPIPLPLPASMLLLGLGSLALMRRRTAR